MSGSTFEILVCKGPECAGKGDADAVYLRLCASVAEQRMSDHVRLDRKNCFGRCTRGPNVYVRTVHPHGHVRWRKPVLYNRVRVGDASMIVTGHIMEGRVLEHLIEVSVDDPASRPQGDPRLATVALPDTEDASMDHLPGLAPDSSENG